MTCLYGVLLFLVAIVPILFLLRSIGQFADELGKFVVARERYRNRWGRDI